MKLDVYCEGETDLPVIRKVVVAAGFEPGTVRALGGYDPVDKLAHRFSQTPPPRPTLLLRDVDPTPPNLQGQRFRQCAPRLLKVLGIQNAGPRYRLRLARHEMEAWLLADARNFARWLGCRFEDVPVRPDEELKPSRTIVELARGRGVKPELRDALVPPEGFVTPYGRRFEDALQRFSTGPWQVALARDRSESLDRCLRALVAFRKELRQVR